MMALATHQVQGSYASSTPLSCKRGTELKQFLAGYPEVERTNITSLKQTSCLRHGSRWRLLRVGSYKGGFQDDEVRVTASGSKPLKNPVKLSYASQNNEDTLSNVPKVHKIHAPSTSDSNETTAGSLAIQQLFKSWLALLRTPSPNQVPDETLEEEPRPSSDTVEAEHKIQTSGRGEILNTVWCNLLRVDATIWIPAMIFIPMYLAVNMKYGAEIARELTPLWICGPLLIALYIKMLQGIYSLYVFSFRQSVKLLKKVPPLYQSANDYVAQGKLKEFIHVQIWQRVIGLRNLDYIELMKKMWKAFQEWVMDKYLDYVESIWPIYCKVIRALKTANFI